MIGFENNISSSSGGTTSTLGKISLTDATSQVFTNQDEAISYINQFTNATLTEVIFDAVTKTLYFTVPAGTLLNLQQGFCGKLTNAERLQFSDVNGLIISYEAQAFEGNECNNTFGSNLFFKEGSFNEAFGINTFDSDNEFAENCFANYTGSAIFKDRNTFLDGFMQSANTVKVTLGNNNVINQGFYLAENNCTITAGNENSFLNNSFQNASINFTCGNTNDFSNDTFNQSTGVVTMGNNNIIGSGSGEEFVGFFTLGNENYIRENSFLNATLEFNCGDRNEFEMQCFYSSSVFGIFGDDNNIGIYCFQQLENSFSSTEKLTFGNRNTFNGWNFSESSNAYLDFGSQNGFFDGSFHSSFDLYIQFSTNCAFRDLCFNDTLTITAKFDYYTEFNGACFGSSLDCDIFIHKGFFENNFAENSTSNFTILGEADFRDDCFRGANPTKKNTVEWIKYAGVRFALNYTGRFDLLSKLGTTPLQNLPNDFFTTSNLVSIHVPNALDYANDGAPDLDLLNMSNNTTNIDRLFIAD